MGPRPKGGNGARRGEGRWGWREGEGRRERRRWKKRKRRRKEPERKEENKEWEEMRQWDNERKHQKQRGKLRGRDKRKGSHTRALSAKVFFISSRHLLICQHSLQGRKHAMLPTVSVCQSLKFSLGFQLPPQPRAQITIASFPLAMLFLEGVTPQSFSPFYFFLFLVSE